MDCHGVMGRLTVAVGGCGGLADCYSLLVRSSDGSPGLE